MRGLGVLRKDWLHVRLEREDFPIAAESVAAEHPAHGTRCLFRVVRVLAGVFHAHQRDGFRPPRDRLPSYRLRFGGDQWRIIEYAVDHGAWRLARSEEGVEVAESFEFSFTYHGIGRLEDGEQGHCWRPKPATLFQMLFMPFFRWLCRQSSIVRGMKSDSSGVIFFRGSQAF